MSRTIGRHRPKSSPRNDYEAMCDYCGVAYLRSQLRRDAAHRLYCRDEGNGRDQVTLGRLIAQDSARPRHGQFPKDGGSFDHSDDPPSTGNPTPFDPGGVPSGGDPGI